MSSSKKQSPQTRRRKEKQTEPESKTETTTKIPLVQTDSDLTFTNYQQLIQPEIRAFNLDNSLELDLGGSPEVERLRQSTMYFEEINRRNAKRTKYMVDKYTPMKILNTIEKIQLLEIEKEFGGRALILAEFVQVFLKHMSFTQHDKLYVTVGLIELFREVKEYEKKFNPTYTTQQKAHVSDDKGGSQPETGVVKWGALTGYLIDNVIQGGNKKSLVPNKYISKNTSENYKQVYASKQLDQFSPEIIGGSSLCLRRFKQSQKLIDSCHHNQGIRNVEYVKELKLILVLDNLADEIQFYNEQSVKMKVIKPKPENHIIDTGILYFTYSVQERRIGACLQDYSLAFWDQSDNFFFEKTFNPHLEVLQIFIKYIEYCTTWVTVDQRNNIYTWDIEKEQAIALPKRHEERITDVCEITHLRLLAACSLDKKIIFWDVLQRLPVQILKLEGVSSHSMCYCQDFRVLITAQYENNISIWSFEGKDCSLLARLKGHNAQVTSIQMLKDTPLLISADEIGFLKTWDIRTCQCVQTVHFECKSSIHQFVNINDSKFIGIEYRLHWFEFEDKAIVNANGIEFLNMSPISIKFNTLFNQLCIATKSDIRVVNIRNGQTEKIIANLVKDEDGAQSSDLTQFIISEDCKKFVVGDNKGNIRTYLYQTSQIETLNQGHNQEITNIRLDDRNGHLLSAGWDSSIIIQKFLGQKPSVQKKPTLDSSFQDRLTPNLEQEDPLDAVDDSDQVAKSQVIRQIKNAHYSQEVSAIQFSLRLSMIATASHGIICVWDYETMRLIGSMTNKFTDILVLEFLDPFALLCSLDVGGQIIIWERLQQFSFSFKIYQPHIILSFSYVPPKASRFEGSQMRGFITEGKDLPPLPTKEQLQSQLIPSKMVKDLLCQEDFERVYTTEEDRKHPLYDKFYDLTEICPNFERRKKAMILVISDDSSGNVFVLDIQSILTRHNLDSKSVNATKRREYNPYRNINLNSNGIFNTLDDLVAEFHKLEKKKEEQQKTAGLTGSLRKALGFKFFQQSSTQQLSSMNVLQSQNSLPAVSPQALRYQESLEISLNEVMHYKFRVATEAIFVLTVIKIPPKVIITSTNSQIVRIWSLFGESLCVLDIDQPLPYKWKLKISSYFRRKKKFQEALYILGQLHQAGGDVSPKKKNMRQMAAEAFNSAFEKPERIRASKRNSQTSLLMSPNKNQSQQDMETGLYRQELLLSHQRFFQNENESVTFRKFLSKIEEEDKKLKNPKNYSLKIMEARKTKPSNEGSHGTHAHGTDQQKHLDNLANLKNSNRQNQGSNIAQFSLLDKIESILNQPKKLDPKTKQWESALDEDFQSLKKSKQQHQMQEDLQRELNHIHIQQSQGRNIKVEGAGTGNTQANALGNLPQIKNDGKLNATKIVEISRRGSLLKLPLSTIQAGGSSVLNSNLSKVVQSQLEPSGLDKGTKKEYHHHFTQKNLPRTDIQIQDGYQTQHSEIIDPFHTSKQQFLQKQQSQVNIGFGKNTSDILGHFVNDTLSDKNSENTRQAKVNKKEKGGIQQTKRLQNLVKKEKHYLADKIEYNMNPLNQIPGATDLINLSKFEPPEENQNIKVHDKSISSYQSGHVITLFGEKRRFKSKGEHSTTSAFPHDNSQILNKKIGKSKLDWLAYAQQKLDSFRPPSNLENDLVNLSLKGGQGLNTTRDTHPNDISNYSRQLVPARGGSLSVRDLKQAQGGNAAQIAAALTKSKKQLQDQNFQEAQKMRNYIFKELDSKRKYFKKHFSTVRDFKYLENMELNDDAEAYEPPQFIRELNQLKKINKKKR